jgi:hypothetical protein
MAFLAKSRIATVLVVVAASSALFAQNDGPDKPQDHASIPDARHIVGQSVVATERSLEARDRYTYVERDQDRRLDSQGQLQSEKFDVTRMILVNGARFGQLVERNGQLPSEEERKKLDQDFEELKHETPQDRTARLGKEQENRSLLRDVVEGFDFRLLAEEVLSGRATYVLQVTPHPGYHARQVRQNVLQGGRQALDRQVGLRLDQGRGSSNAVVLDGIIYSPCATRLAHHPGAEECR